MDGNLSRYIVYDIMKSAGGFIFLCVHLILFSQRHVHFNYMIRLYVKKYCNWVHSVEMKNIIKRIVDGGSVNNLKSMFDAFLDLPIIARSIKTTMQRVNG